jgi:hypothetical protein
MALFIYLHGLKWNANCFGELSYLVVRQEVFMSGAWQAAGKFGIELRSLCRGLGIGREQQIPL